MWSPQHYITNGRINGLPEDILKASTEQIEIVKNGGIELPSILSLNHLATKTKLPYFYLRDTVEYNYHNSYHIFTIKKRSGGERIIYNPKPKLMHIQRWINIHILKKIPAHIASFAFASGGSIVKCAAKHTGAKWLIKMDIEEFFESISEIQVYRVFRGLGYQPLVAFELARICCTNQILENKISKINNPIWIIKKYNKKIPPYNKKILGHLPQGAPTSPMLSNLVMTRIDDKIKNKADEYKLIYTRYSDDLTFSTRRKKFSREEAKSFILEISKILSKSGFKPQHRKTKVIPPGSKKIVLGLGVDGDFPKLSKKFKAKLRQHFYYLNKFGPTTHAKKRKFNSVWGLKAHIRGLVAYAIMVEGKYGRDLLKEFREIDWPI